MGETEIEIEIERVRGIGGWRRLGLGRMRAFSMVGMGMGMGDRAIENVIGMMPNRLEFKWIQVPSRRRIKKGLLFNTWRKRKEGQRKGKSRLLTSLTTYRRR